MKPPRNVPSGMEALFRSRLKNIIDLSHELVRLEEVTGEMERWTGIEVALIYVDKGYQGHDYPNKFKVYKSGQKRGITPTIKKELRCPASAPVRQI